MYHSPDTQDKNRLVLQQQTFSDQLQNVLFVWPFVQISLHSSVLIAPSGVHGPSYTADLINLRPGCKSCA